MNRNLVTCSDTKGGKKLSFVWRFIASRPLGLPSRIVYWLLVLGSGIFSLPRVREAWFLWAVFALPLSMFSMLQLTKFVQRFLNRAHTLGLALLESADDRMQLDGWWNGLDERTHLLWNVFFALVLAGVSLVFNANPRWTRYTDALGFFYQGFVAGEVLYLLLLLPLWMYRLRGFPLRLNPFDPANTVGLSALAETSFGIALITGLSLLVINVVIVAASYLFRHLIFGAALVSISAWIAVIVLAGYPHLVLVRVVQETKEETLRTLEDKLIQQYRDIAEGRMPSSPSIEDTLSLYRHLVESKTLPISNSVLFGIISTLLFNTVPIIVRHFVR